MSAFLEVKSREGRWSVFLAVAFAVVLAITAIIAAIIAVVGPQPWALTVGQPLGLASELLGLASAAVCLYAVFGKHDSRRLLWLIPAMLVLELAVLLGGEILVPH